MATIPQRSYLEFVGFKRRPKSGMTMISLLRLKEILHLVDRGFADRSVEDDLAPRHRHDAVAGLEDVRDVVADENAGDVLRLQAADESKHLPRLLDRQMVGWLVEEE